MDYPAGADCIRLAALDFRSRRPFALWLGIVIGSCHAWLRQGGATTACSRDGQRQTTNDNCS